MHRTALDKPRLPRPQVRGDLLVIEGGWKVIDAFQRFLVRVSPHLHLLLHCRAMPRFLGNLVRFEGRDPLAGILIGAFLAGEIRIDLRPLLAILEIEFRPEVERIAQRDPYDRMPGSGERVESGFCGNLLRANNIKELSKSPRIQNFAAKFCRVARSNCPLNADLLRQVDQCLKVP